MNRPTIIRTQWTGQPSSAQWTGHHHQDTMNRPPSSGHNEQATIIRTQWTGQPSSGHNEQVNHHQHNEQATIIRTQWTGHHHQDTMNRPPSSGHNEQANHHQDTMNRPTLISTQWTAVIWTQWTGQPSSAHNEQPSSGHIEQAVISTQWTAVIRTQWVGHRHRDTMKSQPSSRHNEPANRHQDTMKTLPTLATPHLPPTGTEGREPHTGELPPLLIQRPKRTTHSLRPLSGTNACRPGQPLKTWVQESKQENRSALGEHLSSLSTSPHPTLKPPRQLTFSGEHANCTGFPQTMQRQKTGEREREREEKRYVWTHNTHIPCPHKRTDRVWQIIYIYTHTQRHIYMYTCHNVLEKETTTDERKKEIDGRERNTRVAFFVCCDARFSTCCCCCCLPSHTTEGERRLYKESAEYASYHPHSSSTQCIPDNSSSSSNIAVDPRSP